MRESSPGQPEANRPRRYRRHSTAFKRELVEAYLAGVASAKSLAEQYGVSHSLILTWTKKYRRGELDVELDEESSSPEEKIARLERKVGQLTMELEAMRRRLGDRPPLPKR